MKDVEQHPKRPKRKRIDVIPKKTKMVKGTVVNRKYFEDLLAFVNKSRKKVLGMGERLDILLLHGVLRHRYFEELENSGPGSPVGVPNVTDTIVNMLRRSRKVVQGVWKEYVETTTVTVGATSGYPKPRERAIEDSRYVTFAVQKFIPDRNIKRKRTVAKDV